MSNDNDSITWEEAEPLPATVKTTGTIAEVEVRDAEDRETGEKFRYVDLTVVVENERLQQFLRNGIRVSYPLQAHSESMFGRFLARSGLAPAVGEQFKPSSLKGLTVDCDVHRTEQQHARTKETQFFWNVDRGTMFAVRPGA